QLPEPAPSGEFKHVAEMTRRRLSCAAEDIRANYKGAPKIDPGFRFLVLARAHIRAWQPLSDDLATSLFQHTEHVAPGRTEVDVLAELLLKLGVDLCVPSENNVIASKDVYAVGAGALIVWLA